MCYFFAVSLYNEPNSRFWYTTVLLEFNFRISLSDRFLIFPSTDSNLINNEIICKIYVSLEKNQTKAQSQEAATRGDLWKTCARVSFLIKL